MSASTAELPYLTASLPGTGGALRATHDDFCVDEIPAYEPSGEGDHVYARIEKRDMTTPFAVQQLARALGVDPRDVGYAGLKDRHAVTTQWVSLPKVDPAAVESLAIENLRVLAVSRHRNKLRTGHLRGNRFSLRITGLDDVDGALARAERIVDVLRSAGVPNYYGEQRFGRAGDNADRGFAWLKGGPSPKQPFEKKLFVSAAQSELFNRYLSARVRDGLLATYLDGELAMRWPVGGPWHVDPSEAQGLYDARGASAAGPIFGTKMLRAKGDAQAREERELSAEGLTYESFARARDLGEGSRRPVRMIVDDLRVARDGAALRLTFTLPAGGYATTLAREVMKGAENVETTFE